MILYVNGDSHSAAAEAIHTHCFANDDQLYHHLGRSAHPDHLAVSYGKKIADQIGYDLVCDAESASSNDRILRTTETYLKDNRPDFIIIGWATWERQEFLFGDQYYQFCAGAEIDLRWPREVQEHYREWVLTADSIGKTKFWHDRIWAFHEQLHDIPHLFFNTYLAFNHDFIVQRDWSKSYLNPYSHDDTYYYWLKNQGYQTVNQNSFHFGVDAHQAWANHLTNMLKDSIMFT